MSIEKLEEFILKAKGDIKDICVYVRIPRQEEVEIIINKHSSIENKLKYYKETYENSEEGLVHKHNKDIKIVGVSMMNW